MKFQFKYYSNTGMPEPTLYRKMAKSPPPNLKPLEFDGWLVLVQERRPSSQENGIGWFVIDFVKVDGDPVNQPNHLPIEKLKFGVNSILDALPDWKYITESVMIVGVKGGCEFSRMELARMELERQKTNTISPP